jgi:hemoglobin
MRFPLLIPALFGLIACLSGPAVAGSQGTTLYDDLGGKPVMDRVISDMLERALADPKMAPIFADSDLDRLENLLIIHTCHLADGPCDYDGQDMRRAHDGLGIKTMHFNRLVENLQQAMDAQNIPFRTQNRFLARLAPMHDDVTERSPVPPRNKKPSSYSVAPGSLPTTKPAE